MASILTTDSSLGVKKLSLLEYISFVIVLLGVFLTPLFFIPSATLLFDFSKILFIVSMTLIPFALILIARLKDGKLICSWSLLTLSLWLLPVVSLISALLSPHVATSLVGYGFELGTFGFLAVLVALASLVSYLFRSAERSFTLLIVVLTAALILGLYHVLRFAIGPTFLSFGYFTDIANNTLGKWYDLSLLFGLTAIVSTSLLEQFKLSPVLKIASYVLLGLSVVMLAVVNFFMVWVVVGVMALLIVVYGVTLGKKTLGSNSDIGAEASVPTRTRRLPVIALSLVILSLLFVAANFSLFGSKPLTERLSAKLGISQVEVRPSWTSTVEVARASLKENALFGVGPNRFGAAWTEHKPAGINAWPFWNVDFAYGVGFVPTAFVATGILGSLAWLFFLVMFLLSFVSLFRKPAGDKLSRGLTFSIAMGTLFLWVLTIAYVPSASMLALTFVFTGLYIAALMREGVITVKTGSASTNQVINVFFTGTFVILLVGTLTLAYVYAQKTVASYYFRQGVMAFGANNPAGGEQYLFKAFRTGQNDLYLRSLSDLYLSQINVLLNQDAKDLKPEEIRERFEKLFAAASGVANQAVIYDDSNYQNYISRARVYEVVVPLNIPNSFENAQADYTKALSLNPSSPLIHVLMARLYVAQGNLTDAKNEINTALALKPDYTDAKTFLTQLNDLIKSKAKSASAPVDKTEKVSDTPKKK